MPSDFNHLEYIRPKYSRGGYIALMKMISNSLGFDLSDPARFRHKVLLHYYQYGWRSATDAFGVGRTSLYRWKQRYEKSFKRLNSLVPCSTEPKRLRRMATDWRLVEFIKQMRLTYGNLGKEKIKIFLDQYAIEIGLASSLGCTTIGKIIKRKGFTEKTKRRFVNKRKVGLRVKYAPKEILQGYLELDSVTLFVSGERYYFTTIIDIVSKYAFCRLTRSLTAKNTLNIFKEFLGAVRQTPRQVQTDNGHEFLGEFDKYLVEQNISHAFTYPRSPKINGVVERFNRTIQEEFLNRSDDLITHDVIRLRENLDKYLHWYNYQRPHKSLKLQTPHAFLEQLTIKEKQNPLIPICG
jgi:transposase InsO family protein